MFDEDWEEYDEDVPGGTGFGHNRSEPDGDRCSGKNGGKAGKMSRLKAVEIVLKAVSALIAMGMAIIKFIGLIDKLQAKPAGA